MYMCLDDLKQLCKDNGFDVAIVVGKPRDDEAVKRRKLIACALHALGHSYSDIGRAMNRSHSTIMYMVKDEYGADKRDKMRAYFAARDNITL